MKGHLDNTALVLQTEIKSRRETYPDTQIRG